VVEPRRFELARLFLGQHAERGAGFHAERPHAFDHFDDLCELLLLGAPIGRTHAEPGRAVLLREACLLQHVLDLHERLGLQAGVEADALRAVGAVLRASAGLDRKQGADLHLVRIEMLAMYALRMKHEVGERQRKQRTNFVQSPIGAHFSETRRIERGGVRHLLDELQEMGGLAAAPLEHAGGKGGWAWSIRTAFRAVNRESAFRLTACGLRFRRCSGRRAASYVKARDSPAGTCASHAKGTSSQTRCVACAARSRSFERALAAISAVAASARTPSSSRASSRIATPILSIA